MDAMSSGHRVVVVAGRVRVGEAEPIGLKLLVGVLRVVVHPRPPCPLEAVRNTRSRERVVRGRRARSVAEDRRELRLRAEPRQCAARDVHASADVRHTRSRIVEEREREAPLACFARAATICRPDRRTRRARGPLRSAFVDRQHRVDERPQRVLDRAIVRASPRSFRRTAEPASSAAATTIRRSRDVRVLIWRAAPSR